MKKIIITIVYALLLASIPFSYIQASDTSEAEYYGTILVSNNSTAASGVSTVFTGNTTAWVDVGLMNSTANNTAIVASSGADITYMPGYSSKPWCLWVPSINANSYLTNILYMGGTANMAGSIAWFPDTTGGETGDAASLEYGDNFTQTISAYIDTTQTGANITTKGAAFNVVVGTPSGNITANINNPTYTDNFSGDSWTDVGTPDIYVNTGNSTLYYLSEREATDQRCYKDITSVDDTEWRLDFTWYPSYATDANARFYFGLFSAAENVNGAAGDLIVIQVINGGIAILRKDNTASGQSGTITFSYGNTYYVTLERTSSTEAKLSIYSDTDRSTHIAGSPVTLAIPATIQSLRYIQASNLNAASAGEDEAGQIDELYFYDKGAGNISVTATGIDSGEHNLMISADATNLNIYVDGNLEDSTALLGGVPDNSDNWTDCESAATPYVYYIERAVDGIQVQYIEWDNSDTFNDQSGNSNDLTPTFRGATSDADVTAELLSFSPISEADAPAYALSSAPDFITTTPGLSGSFSTSVDATYPGAEVIEEIAIAGQVPEQLPSMLIFTFIIIVLSLSMSAILRKHGSGALVIKAGVILAIMGVYVALSIYDIWQLYFFLLMALGIMWMSRQREAY